jgi:hypothetical protein
VHDTPNIRAGPFSAFHDLYIERPRLMRSIGRVVWGIDTSPPLEEAIKRSFLPAAGVAIAASVACAAATAGLGQRPSCFPSHAHTVAKDRDVRVYSLTGKTPTRGDIYACLLHRGTMVTLSKPGPRRPASIEHITLAGTIVAFTDSTHGVDTGSTDIVVVDVANRRTLLTVPGAGGFIDACFISFHDVMDLVATRRGSVAWLVRKGAQCKTTTYEVFSARASGAPTLLEEGPAIVPGSLRLSDGTVSWENAGQRKSARLP